jgi:hypothetical protein
MKGSVRSSHALAQRMHVVSEYSFRPGYMVLLLHPNGNVHKTVHYTAHNGNNELGLSSH